MIPQSSTLYRTLHWNDTPLLCLVSQFSGHAKKDRDNKQECGHYAGTEWGSSGEVLSSIWKVEHVQNDIQISYWWWGQPKEHEMLNRWRAVYKTTRTESTAVGRQKEKEVWCVTRNVLHETCVSEKCVKSTVTTSSPSFSKKSSLGHLWQIGIVCLSWSAVTVSISYHGLDVFRINRSEPSAKNSGKGLGR